MITIAGEIYGASCQDQQMSYEPSFTYDFSKPGETRIISVHNYDKTGTHRYSIMVITCNTRKEAEDEFEGQLYDGIFENYEFDDVYMITKA